MNFTKMHGCGNDYIYINGFSEEIKNPSQLSVKMSDRHFGIGSDGLVLILPSKIADFRMRMFNSDGSEAEMCGNAIRCVGKYVYDKNLTEKRLISIETLAGIKVLDLHVQNGMVERVTVDMGEPILTPELIPVVAEENPVTKLKVQSQGKDFNLTCVSMGNPHAVTYIERTEDFAVQKFGPSIEENPLFPKKTNVEFAQIINREQINMRVWERGSGETLACGTGACATLVASVLNGLTERKVTVHLLGGDLEIHWDESTNHVFLTGPAEFVFKGTWLQP
ncbi:MAG: diaminopimelate epimerase [Vallitaleaceae bacterium]|nr:diaminopimelate epimerase [Vallitaleaceae bacterium]